ncbi:MAG: hypothetical protein CMP51_05520 [Flavobacteriales bacterium]|nr:hypothetical protein [Flavobacteriales bacterium]
MEMKNNLKRAKNAILVIQLLFIITIITLITNTSDTINNFKIGVYLLRDVLGIISIITFILWFRRSYYNISLIQEMRFNERWTVGGWFIPIFNAIRPYQILEDLFINTKEICEEKGLNIKSEFLQSKILLYWNILFVFDLYFQGIYSLFKSIQKFGSDNVFNREWMEQNESILNEYMAQIVEQTEVLVLVLYLPLCYFTIKIISQYSKVEEEIRKSETAR